MDAVLVEAMNSLNRDISTLSIQMSHNQEKLNRLKTAHTNIANDQKELMSHKKLLKEPELSSESWAGKHAETFESNREKIENAFNTIAQTHVNQLLENIEAKITSLQSEINAASHSISAKRAELQQLSNYNQ